MMDTPSPPSKRRFSSAALSAFSIFALIAPTGLASAQSMPCQGRYSVVSGNVTISSAGVVQVAPHHKSEGTADLIYESCDRIRLEAQGQKMTLVRSATTGWSATVTGGGATRVFRFNTLTPRLVDSWMDAFGGGVTVQRGMNLTLDNATDGQPTDCIFDSDQQDFSRENAAASAFLAGRGLAPPSPDFVLKDYFRARETAYEHLDETRDGRTRHVSFMLSGDHKTLPTVRAATRFREICLADPGELDRPRYMLNFKIHKLENPDRYNVFAQIIDIDTRGLITAQKETIVEGHDETALTEAMTDAAAQIEADGVTIGPLSDGKLG